MSISGSGQRGWAWGEKPAASEDDRSQRWPACGLCSMSVEGLERTWGWGRAAGNGVCSTFVLVCRSWSRSSLNHLISDT